jgi:hypothetical protein
LPLSPDQARPCAGTDLAADPAFVAAARPIGNR